MSPRRRAEEKNIEAARDRTPPPAPATVCVPRFISPAARNFIAGRTIFLVESAVNKRGEIQVAMSEIRGSLRCNCDRGNPARTGSFGSRCSAMSR